MKKATSEGMLEIGYRIKDCEVIDGIRHIKEMDLLEVSFKSQSDYDLAVRGAKG